MMGKGHKLTKEEIREAVQAALKAAGVRVPEDVREWTIEIDDEKQ